MLIQIIINTIFVIGTVVVAITIHEFFHILMSNLLGDDTGKKNGRLSFDPLKHIDLTWTIVLPFFLVILPFFSYASINALPLFAAGRQRQYDNQQLQLKIFNYKLPTRFLECLIALAGPLANLTASFLSLGILLYLGPFYSELIQPFAIVNMYMFLFNLFPIPPLDGTKLLTLFFSEKTTVRYEKFAAKLFWPFLFFLIFYGNSILDNAVKEIIQAIWYFLNEYFLRKCVFFDIF